MSKSIILLSGGLDSAVSLRNNINIDNIELALFFNYGQKAYENEKKAVENLCDYYSVKFEEINLEWLKNISNTSLVGGKDVPELSDNDLDNIDVIEKTMQAVWIPNRNGLFLNIAASFADSFGFDKIIIGANKEEAQTFSDNSENFIEAINKEFEFSTLIKPKIIAPLINLDKSEIITLAIKLDLPFNLLWSCYKSANKHCGVCESCKRLKRALENNGLSDIVHLMFE